MNFLIDVRVRVSRNKASFYLDSFIIIHASYGSYSEYCRDLTHTHKATLLSGGLLRTGAIMARGALPPATLAIGAAS